MGESLRRQSEGPVQEGPIEVHAVSGKFAFVLLSEDAYFRRQGGAEAFEERSHRDGSDSEEMLLVGGGRKYDLCHERLVHLHLLRFRGWEVVELPFYLWRHLKPSARRSFIGSV